MIKDKLIEKKKILDSNRPLAPELVRNLDEWFRIELTYTSNAIEGNTLTRKETALVVEKGLTVGGKSLIEHLEATNHAKALDFIMALVQSDAHAITESDILRIHQMILKNIDDFNAGHYRSIPVRISGSNVILPNAAKVPDLMSDFARWLKEVEDDSIFVAAEAHYRLVTIHPFVDGNGRTARLLMNLILLMNGYPPAIIRPQDRLSYISALEKGQLGGSKDDYFNIIMRAIDRSLNIYLKAIKGETGSTGNHQLLKIGELATRVGEVNSTIRHWTKEGLLEVSEITAGGFALYSYDMIGRIQQIKELKIQRYNLQEIKMKLVDFGNKE